MDEDKYNMAIISDQAVRAKLLSQIIKQSFNHVTEVPVLQTNKLDSIKKFKRPLLLLVDLMGIAKTSKEIILPVKEIDDAVKIIALHLYRSPTLVNPLFEMGINGYMYYEPSREELKLAIHTVMSEKRYVPEYLLTS